MLAQLSVKNLAVVEHLDLSFDKGMSVVTGETGAGKSILLQALNLALGGRGDSSLVRHGKDKAEVSASFDVMQHKKIQNYLKEQSLEDDGECILRRIISSDGRSKAFVNGVSVPLSIVKSVGELLIDMHGQNEHQLLLRNDQQRQLLDAYANTGELCAQLNKVVAQHKKITTQIDELTSHQDARLQQQELLGHQLKELEDAALSEDELNSIESDFKTSANAATLIEKTSSILSRLESDTGVNTQLLNLNHELSQAQEMDDKLSQAVELLSSAQVQAQEGVYELTHYLSGLSVDEQSASELEDRLSEFHDLSRKHNCQIPELLKVQEKIQAQLDEIGGGASSLDALNTERSELKDNYQKTTQRLTKARAYGAKELSDLVTQSMQMLGMPGSEFMVGLVPKTEGVQLNGAETVDFLVKTNMGQDFKALKKVASGGELSRISLAISVVSSDSEYTPTLIFDEVDVGISGAVAEVVGQKLKELSRHYQVVCITHLAQVASFGHQHLRVSKTQKETGAKTTVERLSDVDRVSEVARILSGTSVSDKARKAAAEMITKSSN